MSHQIKIARAKRLSVIGDAHTSFAAMLAYIPEANIKALSARQIAAQVDNLWKCAGTSKAIADREALENGFVWDVTNNRPRKLAA